MVFTMPWSPTKVRLPCRTQDLRRCLATVRDTCIAGPGYLRYPPFSQRDGAGDDSMKAFSELHM
jgi:hypothetical protein